MPRRKKKARESLTLQAQCAKSFIPFIAYVVARNQDVPMEIALGVAASIYACLELLVMYGLRRAIGDIGAAVLLLSMTTGCVNDSQARLILDSYKLYTRNVGNSWVEYVKKDPTLNDEDRSIRIDFHDQSLEFIKEAEKGFDNEPTASIATIDSQ